MSDCANCLTVTIPIGMVVFLTIVETLIVVLAVRAFFEWIGGLV